MSDAPVIRTGTRDDLDAIVRMLADDPLGAARERYEEPLPACYADAFAAIEEDPNNEVLVACVAARVVGTLQLTYLPNLSHQGAWRGQIEGVRVARDVRARGVGQALVESAIERSRGRGCRLLQLTTDKARPDALRFYERLGFVASHEGMKLKLGD